MKCALKLLVIFFILFMICKESYGQILNTITYRDTTLPRIDKDPFHYGFIYPIEKDFYDSTSFTPPNQGRFFVQNYGPRTIGNYDNHQGTDIWGRTVANGVSTSNPPALCMCDGIIEKLIDGPDSTIELTSSGRVVRLLCESFSQVFASPIHIAYLHLDSISSKISLGSRIQKGDTLGIVGQSGTTSLNHLHLDYYGIPNQWGNQTTRKFLNPMRLFDPDKYPHVIGKLDNAHIEILHDWEDSALIRIHWPHNQHINWFEFTNGAYHLVYDVEEVRASYPVFEPSIWARDSMKIFPYRTNGSNTALYYENNYTYPAFFPNSPSRDTNLAVYGYKHIPLTADSVVNVYDFILENLPANHDVNDWIVKLSDVWGYTVEGQLSNTSTQGLGPSAPLLTVYPNPTSEFLHIEFEGELRNTSLHISNILGELIMSKHVKTNLDPIDIRHFPKGVYFLSLRGQTIKFIRN